MFNHRPLNMKISFVTLGCKLNQAETDELKQSLKQRGIFAVPFGSDENVCVVRACGVTCGASQTTREYIRRAKRQGIYVITSGCLENSDLKEIDFIAKNNEAAFEHILNLRKHFSTAKNQTNQIEIERTRAFIKIQTGCNFQCAYCIIPYFRGQTKSVPTNLIIERINDTVKHGYKEVVLTGVNICLYKDKKNNLAELLKFILQKTKIKRIRLGSLDPRLISEKLIKLYSNQQINNPTNQRLMPHWHLSLQSGADNVLKNMRREYTTKKYSQIIKKIRSINPLFSFTTDIIVGFPGESEKDFKKTCDFVELIKFAKVHVFPFSPRPNTKATKIKNIVPDKIKTERAKKLRQICTITAHEYAQKIFNQTRPVLFEHKKSAFWRGYTPEYLPVKIKSEKNLTNKIISIKLTDENIV